MTTTRRAPPAHLPPVHSLEGRRRQGLRDGSLELERLADDGVGEVRVALGGGRLTVAEHLADDRQGHAAHEGVAGERVPQVVVAAASVVVDSPVVGGSVVALVTGVVGVAVVSLPPVAEVEVSVVAASPSLAS